MSARTTEPWAWFGNTKTKEIYLATVRGGRRIVMGFCRFGMRNAQPVFVEREELVPASELCRYAVGNENVRGHSQAVNDSSIYRFDISEIDNSCARIIAAAPEVLQALNCILKDPANDLTNESKRLGWAAVKKAEGRV